MPNICRVEVYAYPFAVSNSYVAFCARTTCASARRWYCCLISAAHAYSHEFKDRSYNRLIIHTSIIYTSIEIIVNPDRALVISSLPVVLASDRDPLASGLGLSTLISRALSSRVSFPGLCRAYPRARTLGVARRRRAKRP